MGCCIWAFITKETVDGKIWIYLLYNYYRDSVNSTASCWSSFDQGTSVHLVIAIHNSKTFTTTFCIAHMFHSLWITIYFLSYRNRPSFQLVYTNECGFVAVSFSGTCSNCWIINPSHYEPKSADKVGYSKTSKQRTLWRRAICLL